MDDSAIKKYLSDDYAKAVKFYDERANTSKLLYRVLSIYLMVVSAVLTPVIAFSPNNVCWRIISAGLSMTLVIVTGLLAHLKCHENWLSYRASWDALNRERRLYETGAGIYASEADRGALFVERIEKILTREGTDFYARHAKREKPPKNLEG